MNVSTGDTPGLPPLFLRHAAYFPIRHNSNTFFWYPAY
ncbi:hypothetical protein SRB521_00712 [Intestinimonas butyriciproducens]|nr:hypothetical protein SRB521_00712 [Intestinimonas butyriciproducens]